MPVALPVSLAAVLHGANDLRVEQRSQAAPRAGEAQVAVLATGLCGSDLHYFQHGSNGDFALREPLVLGHEAAGVITAVGEGVANLTVGQHVAIEPGIMCRACTYCLTGRYNLCPTLRFASSAKTFPHLDGTLQTRMNHPAHVLHPIPENCTPELAALAEPLSVVLHATSRLKIHAGQSVFVLGTGSIGILACALLRLLGASRIAAADINRARLDWTLAHGVADEVFHVPVHVPTESVKPKGSAADEAIRRSKEYATEALTSFGLPQGFDLVVECTGVESSMQMGISCAKPGGAIMVVGMGTPIMTIPISAATLREVDVFGTFRYANTFPQALNMLASGQLRGVDQLITHRFPLDRAIDAFQLLRNGVDDKGNIALKVVVEPSAVVSS